MWCARSRVYVCVCVCVCVCVGTCAKASGENAPVLTRSDRTKNVTILKLKVQGGKQFGQCGITSPIHQFMIHAVCYLVCTSALQWSTTECELNDPQGNE